MINRDWFKKIDTQEKAYWLGFLLADGCVYSSLKQVSLLLSQKDSAHLEKYASIFSVVPQYYTNFDKRTGHLNHMCRVVLSSVDMCTDLIAHGCVPQKTLNLSDYVFDKIDSSLWNHLCRGYFDGDGCISFTNGECRVSICGTKTFLDKYSSIIEEIGVEKVRVRGEKGVYGLHFANRFNMMKFRDWLYRDATVFLERKKERFDSIRQKGSSSHRGVSWCNTRKRWIAKKMVNRKCVYIGSFLTEEDAAYALVNFRGSF